MEICIGIGELAVVHAPNVVKTVGLGSCVGVVLFDPSIQVAGMIHIMLPIYPGHGNETKYADTGIRKLIAELERAGVTRLQAKIAGGAQMFATLRTMQMGLRNVENTRKVLAEERIPVISEDVGGNIGRTIVFNPIGMQLTITTREQSRTI